MVDNVDFRAGKVEAMELVAAEALNVVLLYFGGVVDVKVVGKLLADEILVPAMPDDAAEDQLVEVHRPGRFLRDLSPLELEVPPILLIGLRKYVNALLALGGLHILMLFLLV